VRIGSHDHRKYLEVSLELYVVDRPQSKIVCTKMKCMYVLPGNELAIILFCHRISIGIHGKLQNQSIREQLPTGCVTHRIVSNAVNFD
jgi:hypothetical protein